MKRITTSLAALPLLSIAVVIGSIWADWGSESWGWFQRSGSWVALTGAVLTYRSIMRLGVPGVGGVDTTFARGKIVSSDDSGQTVSVAFDEETSRSFAEADLDRVAGCLGAVFILAGTFIWGYGDLVGRIFS